MVAPSQTTLDAAKLYQLESLAAKLARHDTVLLKGICEDLQALKSLLEPLPQYELGLSLSHVAVLEENNIKIKSLLD